MSLAEAETRLKANNWDLEALLTKADHFVSVGDHRAANSFYSAVVRGAHALQAQSASTRAAYERASAMIDWCSSQFRDHLLGYLNDSGFTPENRHPRFQVALDMMLGERHREPDNHKFPQTPLTFFYPDMPYCQFAETKGLDWVTSIEAQAGIMREEALRMIGEDQHFSPYSQTTHTRHQSNAYGLIDNDDWSTSFLWKEDGRVEENAARCPEILATITRHAPLCMIKGRAPSIMLSRLRAGAHIPPHSGMLNCRLICHLPLIVPPDCAFRVGNDVREWEEGKIIIFDDSVQHEAWNRSDGDRLVVIFDIWRPEIEDEEKASIEALFVAVDSYR